MGQYPRYSYPFWKTIRFAGDVLAGRRRSFRQDAISCFDRLKPPLLTLGCENIPISGPCVVTFNHYFRPGFRAWWLALAIASVLPVEMRFIMTSEWTFPGRWYAPQGAFLSRWVITRVAKSYSFTTMPPMPPRLKDVLERATAVRTVLSYVRHTEKPVIGLAPEGGDTTDGQMSRPPPGVGRFALLLAGAGLKMIPVGAYEAEGVFCLSFGQAYMLHVPDGLSTKEKDQFASRTMMERIAGQLPPHLRGRYGYIEDL